MEGMSAGSSDKSIPIVAFVSTFLSATIVWHIIVTKPTDTAQGFLTGFITAWLNLFLTSFFLFSVISQRTISFERITKCISSAFILTVGGIFFLPWHIVPIIMGIVGVFYLILRRRAKKLQFVFTETEESSGHDLRDS